jgi:hypothetical protein
MFKQWLQRWLGVERDVIEHDNDIWTGKPARLRRARHLGPIPLNHDSTSTVDSRAPNSFTLNVYPAAGGRIVEYKYFDPDKDETICSLHIIPQDQDLHLALTKIVTFEELRK